MTADGRVVRASESENPELFWGLRGGGGNFGVVTEFEFQLHPVGPILMAGMMLFPRERAREVLRTYRDFIESAPDEVGGGAALITAPPEPFIPEEVRGKPALGIIFCHVGPVEDGEKAFSRCAKQLQPLVDIVQPMPYAAMQQMIDAGNPFGVREYFKVDWLRELSDEAIDVDRRSRRAAAGAVRPADPRADGRRDRPHRLEQDGAQHAGRAVGLLLPGDVDGPAEDDDRTGNGRAASRRRWSPFGVGTSFPNFIEPDEGNPRLRASLGPEKYDRLAALKREWDPDNLFRLNQNIAPAA